MAVWFGVLCSKSVWFGVFGAKLVLFGVLVDVNQVQSSVAGGNSDSVWTLPAFCCELLFLLWISLAVQDTLKKLKAARQTLKASMYEQLIRIVMVIGTCWFIFVLLRLQMFIEIAHIAA